MEYTSFDDKEDNNDDKSSDDIDDNESDDEEEEDKGDKGEMKLKKTRDLGSQSAFSILSDANPSLRFQKITQAFPTYASQISKIRKKRFKLPMREIGKWHESGLASKLPLNSLYLNGKRVNLGANTFNVYDLLSTIRGEYRELDKLSKFSRSKADGGHGMSLTSVRELAEVAAHLSSQSGGSNSDGNGMMGMMMGGSGAGDVEDGIIRIDVSRGAKQVVTFMNNLEDRSNPTYSRWSKKMAKLLEPTWSIQPIARNLYTALLAVDVLTYEGAVLAYVNASVFLDVSLHHWTILIV